MHWPLALVIGIEVANDDMTRFDDGPAEEEDGPIIHLNLQDERSALDDYATAKRRYYAARDEELLDQADVLLEALRDKKAGLYGFTPRTQRAQRLYAMAERGFARRMAA
jgi:hypothetical protein